MSAALVESPEIRVVSACEALMLARPTFYRHRPSKIAGEPNLTDAEGQPNLDQIVALERRPQPRALTVDERNNALALLTSERFRDAAPRQVYATLLDEKQYYCSVSTFYRLLRAECGVRERRDQLRHPAYSKPELLATAPNQVWSWDITKLLGPVKWTYFYLYVILDIFSRCVVGWMVASGESADLARELISQTCVKQAIQPGQLIIHADRGSPMKAKPVALLMADLGVTKTHSRPHTSNDNPYSESQFKTLKYRPDFPDRFGSIQHARSHCRGFFQWYNTEHHHSGIALHTPENVHYGLAQALDVIRQETLLKAYAAHPDRFVAKLPKPPQLPPAVWINPPKPPIDGGESDTDPALH